MKCNRSVKQQKGICTNVSYLKSCIFLFCGCEDEIVALHFTLCGAESLLKQSLRDKTFVQRDLKTWYICIVPAVFI